MEQKIGIHLRNAGKNNGKLYLLVNSYSGRMFISKWRSNTFMSKIVDSMLDWENPKLITKEELKARHEIRREKLNITPFDSRERETLEIQYAYGNGRY